MINFVISSILSSLIYSTYLEVKDYKLGEKKSGKKINFEELSYESEDIKKDLKRYLFDQIKDISNLDYLIPIYNIYIMIERILMEESYIDDYKELFDEVIPEINSLERKVRKENYELLKLTMEQTKLNLKDYKLIENDVPESIFEEIIDLNNLEYSDKGNVKVLEKKNS